MNAPVEPIHTVGILGVGKVGSAIARQAQKAGYQVKVATAQPAEEIRLLTEIVIPGATAVDAHEAADADLVIVAVPLPKYRSVDPGMLAGKTVIDVMNYWSPTDGALDDFENDARTSSEVIQDHLAGSKLVKTLNHIGYHDLEADDRVPGAADRRALAVVSDHDEAKELVSGFIDRLGYDVVDAGSLAAGRIFQPGTTIFNGSHTGTEMHRILAAASEHSLL
ncbi:NADPH-dependent F420 reductase [Corynebacterium sp. A21]|uniref:NADPH-dependent F420 reductase n=1 Tax=Corynebacterium sp. A21 TaxID=3457318 RepID=UPI003FD47CF7